MNESKLQAFRDKYSSQLTEYLQRADIECDGVVTVCPQCGQMAGLRKDDTWLCVNCGAKGDLLDYVLTGHPYMRETSAMHHIRRTLGERITELDAINGNDLMDMEFRQSGWLIEDLMGKGLYILAGASKIGKSWLVLWLADRVSKGEPVWEKKTYPCKCLYISLEDTNSRMQQRLLEVTDGEAGGLWIATESEWLGKGFETQLCNFIREHQDVRFVIVDTFQRIRKQASEKYSYAGDYEVMTILKEIADRFGITILLVHHARKEDSEDPFNQISGTTGLMGCADGAMLLQRKDRLSGEALLYATSRDCADQILRLRFNGESKKWDFLAYEQEQRAAAQPDKLFQAIHDLIEDCGKWSGTATELVMLLSDVLPPDTKPHALSRKLNTSSLTLEKLYGVKYRAHRSMDTRIICLTAVHDAMTQSETPEIVS